MFRGLAFTTVLLSATWVIAAPTVYCDHGQSLSRMLSQMNKSVPTTILVQGTCTESIQITGFDGLTLKGLPGATLRLPATDATNTVLSIEASRSVTVDGFTIHSGNSAESAVGIRGNSLDIRLRNLTIDGSWGIVVYEASQASLAKINIGISSGYAAISVYDVSDVHLEDAVLDNRTTDGTFHAGVFVYGGHVTMHGTAIRNMEQSIRIDASGSVDMNNFGSFFPPTASADVIIDNPAGTNFWGVQIASSSSLNLGDSAVNLRIVNAGQTWVPNTAAVLVSDNSTLIAAGNLVISGSHGQGVMVANNSHAMLAGSSIVGGGHGGIVSVNHSTVAVQNSNRLTEISGNATDLFCDSRSEISGGVNIVNANTVQCSNLLPGEYENLP